MSLLDGVLQLIFPDNVACFVCNEPACADEYGLCEGCRSKIRPAGEIKAPFHLKGITSGLIYDDILHAPMHKLKYSGAGYISKNLASFIDIPSEWPLTCVVPVPLHGKKLKERGYNQSALISKFLSKRYALPVNENMLRRVRDTRTQTNLSREERMENVRSAFIANPLIEGEIPLLVDDVLTTGSTLSACAQALINAGAVKVYAATACAAELKRH